MQNIVTLGEINDALKIAAVSAAQLADMGFAALANKPICEGLPPEESRRLRNAKLYPAESIGQIRVALAQRFAEPTSAADVPASGAAALSEYLKTCEQHQIVPDVGGAFASAFAAGFNLASSQAAQREATAAIKTLQNLGYTYHDAELWKPPIGKVPDFDLVDSPRNRISELEASQAAPAAVAVPDERAAFEAWAKSEDMSVGSDCDGYIHANTAAASQAWQARAALAATPAAAPGKLGDDMQMRCRKCGEQVKIEFNSARIVTHNPHTGKPRDARDIESDPEGKLIAAPGPLFAAAAPVVLPEPDAVISELMGLVDEWGMESHLRGEAELDAQHSEATQEEIDCAKDRASKERAAWKAIESKLRALLATATGLPAQARSKSGWTFEELEAQIAEATKADPENCRAVGEELLKSIHDNFTALKAAGWDGPVDSPVEVVTDLLNLLDEAKAAAPQAQADARDAESDYQRGYRHGYNRRDAEVQGALL